VPILFSRREVSFYFLSQNEHASFNEFLFPFDSDCFNGEPIATWRSKWLNCCHSAFDIVINFFVIKTFSYEKVQAAFCDIFKTGFPFPCMPLTSRNQLSEIH